MRKIKKIENKNLEKISGGWFASRAGLYSLSQEEIDRLRSWGFKIDFGGFFDVANLGRKIGYFVLDENGRTAPIRGVRTVLGLEQQNVRMTAHYYTWPFLDRYELADSSMYRNKE